jgi:hypothetical protein
MLFVGADAGVTLGRPGKFPVNYVSHARQTR